MRLTISVTDTIVWTIYGIACGCFIGLFVIWNKEIWASQKKKSENLKSHRQHPLLYPNPNQPAPNGPLPFLSGSGSRFQSDLLTEKARRIAYVKHLLRASGTCWMIRDIPEFFRKGLKQGHFAVRRKEYVDHPIAGFRAFRLNMSGRKWDVMGRVVAKDVYLGAVSYTHLTLPTKA